MTLATKGIDLNVTYVNPNTKKAQHMINAFINSRRGDSIFKAYAKPSQKKIEAFYEIEREMRDVDGYGMRITGAGSDIFSCAYKLVDPEGHTYLIYHTPCNRFAIKLD